MKGLECAKARSVDGAIQLSTSESRFLGGGIDLLSEMKEYIVSPKRVIDLKTIPNLDRIDTSTETWKLGANVRIAEIARNDQIRGFSVAGTKRIDQRLDRIDCREPRLEGYTADT